MAKESVKFTPSKQMVVYEIPIAGLRAAPYNPRVDLKAGDREYEDIKRSLQQFGQVQPLLYTPKRKYIIGGAQRLKVMRDLGYKTVKVTTIDVPNLKKEKALNTALNKIGGLFDQDKLKILAEEGVFDGEFVTGFSMDEIEAFVSQEPPHEDPHDPPVDPDTGGDEPTVYQIVVDCDDEAHQKQTLKRIRALKLSARAVTI